MIFSTVICREQLVMKSVIANNTAKTLPLPALKQIIACTVNFRGFCLSLQLSVAAVAAVVRAFVLESMFKYWRFMVIDVFKLFLLTL